VYGFHGTALHILVHAVVLIGSILPLSCKCVILLDYFVGTDASFTRTPNSTTLIPGSLLRLNCGSSLSATPVLWSFQAEGFSASNDITRGGGVLAQFTPYFYIDSSRKYDLVAHTSNANESYCGTYKCIEDAGVGDVATATVSSM